MALDRGILANIDRQVFAELGHIAATQALKIPLSDAAWSTWRRYCQAIGLTMGEAVAGLIDHELLAVVDETTSPHVPLFAARREEELAARESRLLARERDLAKIEERNHEWTERLGYLERDLQARERRLELVRQQDPISTAAAMRVGRNERCPCGSGLKYKHCHDLNRPGFSGVLIG